MLDENSSGKDLIIPDIHHKWRCADRIIGLEEPDRIWFLGDYFDDFNDSLEDVEETCEWLVEVSRKSQVHLLLGNHDIYYLCDHRDYRGAGYSPEKHFVVRKYLPESFVRDHCRLYARVTGYLLSHAGFSGKWLSQYSVPLLERHLSDPFEKLLKHNLHPLLDVGEDRGGSNQVGGVTWCDWRSFKPVPGLPQVVGHTVATLVRWTGFERRDDGTFNYDHSIAGNLGYYDERTYVVDDEVSLCLDTNLQHYAVMQFGQLQVRQTPPAFLRKRRRNG